MNDNNKALEFSIVTAIFVSFTAPPPHSSIPLLSSLLAVLNWFSC